MEALSGFSTVQSVLQMEKEIFWLNNKHLSPDERQRQWSDKTAGLTSVLGPAAPVPRLDLDLETSGQREMQQLSIPATVPRVIPELTRPCSVWFPILLDGHPGLTLAIGQPSYVQP